MRKLAAISFLLLLAFNLIGYRFWFYYAQQHANAQLVAHLDKEQYEEKDLITITVPLALPYQTDWNNFERVDGQIEVQGRTYHFVKRKVVDGQMVLLCLPDAIKPKIESARDEFFKLANMLQADAPAKKSSNSNTITIKSVLSDFDAQMHVWSIESCTNTVVHDKDEKTSAVITSLIPTPEQPPEV
ncbi:MAG: hypothetical protein M3342_14400 [Bacteroidota bacterium]|nr:hypothetical protein [Flavisolibacter sp.]MDQ3845183.1 hypothetical protein [Bacteroidota bacterium]MBD0284047.1 hypothetical protein [Flavisolibacter sp.]MBD0296775.1 hypothetical protein [Flavisolibacter sp.]MBD0349657.1 hypothetical protein [Flavisolibacter sp.]